MEGLVRPFGSAVAESVVRAISGVLDECVCVGLLSDVFFRVFHDHAALVMERRVCAWDMFGETPCGHYVGSMGKGACLVGDYIEAGVKRKLGKWCVVILVAFHPADGSGDGKRSKEHLDALCYVVIRTEVREHRCIVLHCVLRILRNTFVVQEDMNGSGRRRRGMWARVSQQESFDPSEAGIQGRSFRAVGVHGNVFGEVRHKTVGIHRESMLGLLVFDGKSKPIGTLSSLDQAVCA